MSMFFVLKIYDGSEIKIPLDEKMLKIFSDGHFTWNIKHMHDQLTNEDSLYKELFEGKVNPVMIDIGANIGIYSVYFHKQCKKIYSVEPSPQSYEVLKYLSSYLNNVEAHKIAISNKNGYIDFYCLSPFNQSSSIYENDGVKFFVKSKTLVDYVKSLNEEIDIIKIDTEGAENLFITEEAVKTLKPIVKQYYVECHDTEKIDGNTRNDNFLRFKEIFENQGYKIKSINDERFITLI